MTTRKGSSVADTVTTSTSTNHQNQQRSRTSNSGNPASEAAGGGTEMFGEFQDWCLRTYGDSGKTKTVTLRKYNKILQTLLQGDEENSNGVFLQEKSNNHINAKFKFWVKSKGFQVGTLQDGKNGSSDRPVLYVPIKAPVAKTGRRLQCVDGVSGVDSSLKRVAVVEDFFDIIYAMHVEVGADPGKAPKHAGQKKTYKAIAETYAFLPREAVTRFLMSCGECQKRMHISTTGQDYKGTNAALQLLLKVHATQIQDESSLSSEEEADMNEATWLSADLGAVSDLSPPSRGERMRHSPQNTNSKEDDGIKVKEESSYTVWIFVLCVCGRQAEKEYIFFKVAVEQKKRKREQSKRRQRKRRQEKKWVEKKAELKGSQKIMSEMEWEEEVVGNEKEADGGQS
ncbi:Nucleolar protein 4 Nucleolar-localized protein [Channa argus]|uniref:Nucleolar protein 4 Nucleolar-localized protein n=1 Tax=Channa argus TaxID=215402 RepID=A0A6G1Q4E2_CHAAH|nr:Nucleolar protein 4 Nucleolar-localized protein [Channa argus]